MKSLLRFLAVALLSGVSAQEPSASLPAGEPLLAESALPDYERDLDHAGLIRAWGKGSLVRGREIYQQACHSCHGDLSVAGSIPNALRFGQGKFQHGSDPYTIYQTLTRGWRLMAPQVQLVPQEKYAVIHYIRDAFLKEHNPTQWREVDDAYLATLPRGAGTGPRPVKREPWKEMDYGNFLLGTFEIADAVRRSPPPPGSLGDYIAPDANLAYKAIAIRLDPGDGGVARGKVWLAFEHDTMRVAGAWTGEGFIDWQGINFNGAHVVRPRTVGTVLFETADVPGWANPETGRFDDARLRGLDGRRYGPLPRTWARYRGLYRDDARVVVAYDVGEVAIRESYELEWSPGTLVTEAEAERNAAGTSRPREGSSSSTAITVRILNVDKSSRDLVLRAANAGANLRVMAPASVKRSVEDGFEVIRIPASATPLKFAIRHAAPGVAIPTAAIPPRDLAATLSIERKAVSPRSPGLPRAGSIETTVIRGASDGPFALDSFSLPARDATPTKSWMRLSGLDFVPAADSAVVCTWDGDVWRVDGITGNQPTVSWRRIASGLFQPLGIKIVDGAILVSCRDQIVRLHDRDGDGETDFYESFDSNHQVTEHFHEFAMGLQRDSEGNLYYAKSARHNRPPLVPHHGTLLKVSADGTRTEILANGFRAANGVCRNPDGTFFVTDQEGHWMPMNRINAVRRGGFYGNMWSYGAPDDASDSAMELPLCWIDKQFDRSPSELLWVESRSWGTLNGKLLNLSYGRGRVEIVPHERIGDRLQGGVCVLPIPDFPTGTMRGRFHPTTGDLYLCGLSAWGTEQLHLPGGFYRVRATGKPVHVPIELRAHHDGIDLTFSDPLDRASVSEGSNFKVSTWSLTRSARYGSARNDVSVLDISAASLLADGRTVRLTLPQIKPTWQMEIHYDVKSAEGAAVRGTLQNTIHVLGEPR
jgi:hypothetical protein